MKFYIKRVDDYSSNSFLGTTILFVFSILAIAYLSYSDELIPEENLIESSGKIEKVSVYRRKGFILVEFEKGLVLRYENAWFKNNLDEIKVDMEYSYSYAKSKSSSSEEGIELRSNDTDYFTYEEYLFNYEVVSPICGFLIVLLVFFIWLDSFFKFKGYKLAIKK